MDSFTSLGDMVRPVQPCSQDAHNTSVGAGSAGFNASEAEQFLELLGKDAAATWIRCIKSGRSGASEHQGLDSRWITRKTDAGFNLYAVIGNADAATGKGGGVQDTDITTVPALFVEWDDGASIEEQMQRWQALNLPEPTVMVSTGGKSVHCYWVLLQPLAPLEWKRITARLIAHCSSDKSCSNPSRLMRLPGSIYYDKKTSEPTGQCRIVATAGHRYSAFDIEACLPPPAPAKATKAAPSRQWEPRPEADLIDALGKVPAFDHDQGRRDELLGLSLRLTAEVGAARGLQLMQEHSPAITDLGDYFKTEPDRINAGSIWPFLREHYGIDISRSTTKTTKTAKTVNTSRPGTGASTPPASVAGFIHQLPDGWVVDEETGVKKRSGLSVGHLADLLEAQPPHLRFNEMTMFVEVETTSGWVAMRDADMNSAYVLLSQKGWVIGIDPITKAICHVAQQQSFHPVRQYLLGLEQGTSTAAFDLDEVAPRFFRSTDPLHVAMVRKWLIGAVWRAMDPGCQMDYCLVLQSRHQGIGKTTGFKALASPEWFNSSAPDGDKDFLLNVHSCWIFEMGELESHTGKRSAGHMKNLITITTDNFRAPYGRNNEPHRRGSVFCGTVNEESFLRDETGNRRYWVVPIAGTEPLDRDGLTAARDGIWKAAMAAYRANELPMLTRAQEALSEIQNETFTYSDPWLEMLQNAIESNPPRWQMPFSTAEALAVAGLKNSEQITRADETRIAPVLRQLGFNKAKNPATTGDGKRIRLWSTAQPAQPCTTPSGGGCAPPEPLRQKPSQRTAQPAQPISSKKTKGGDEQAAAAAAASLNVETGCAGCATSPKPLCRNGSDPAQPPKNEVVQVVQVVQVVPPSTRQENEQRIRALRPGTADMADWPDAEVADLRQSLEQVAKRKRKRTPSGLIDIPYEESARADADGHRLYSMAQRLEITPVQAIVRFFTRGKGQCKIQSDFEGLIKILRLLPDCDWHQDPAIYTDGETKRRAVIRERGKPWMTTEILSQEDVTEQYLKPLLGETFNVAEFLSRLVKEGLTPEEGAKVLELAVPADQARRRPPLTTSKGGSS
jgi:hypothetical protein